MTFPAVKRKALVLLAGMVWTAVGVILLAVALEWLRPYHSLLLIPLGIGVVAGAIIYRFGFSMLALNNLARINSLSMGKDKVSLFAFQNRKSYLIIAVMMLLGYEMRHSAIPKIYLAPLYMAIGLGLIFSSRHYYSNLF